MEKEDKAVTNSLHISKMDDFDESKIHAGTISASKLIVHEAIASNFGEFVVSGPLTSRRPPTRWERFRAWLKGYKARDRVTTIDIRNGTMTIDYEDRP